MTENIHRSSVAADFQLDRQCTPATAEPSIMAEQEAMASKKYGSLAPKNAAAAMRRREGMKRFDSADFEMQKNKGSGQQNLLSRTLAAEANGNAVPDGHGLTRVLSDDLDRVADEAADPTSPAVRKGDRSVLLSVYWLNK